jgi:hypothetical protein
MSGKYKNAFLRAMRVSPFFLRATRGVRLNTRYLQQRRYATIYGKGIGKDKFIIESNARSAEEIHEIIIQDYPAICENLMLSRKNQYQNALKRYTRDCLPTKEDKKVGKKIPARNVSKKDEQKLVRKGDRDESVTVIYSEAGKKATRQIDFAAERALSLLSEEQLHRILECVEKFFIHFNKNYEIIWSKLLDIDEQFKIPIISVRFDQASVFLKHTNIFPEEGYVDFDALKSGDEKFEYLKKVCLRKFRISDADMISHNIIPRKNKKTGETTGITFKSSISAHRTAAVINKAKCRKTDKIVYVVSNADVEMALNWTIITEEADSGKKAKFQSEVLAPGTSFAFGGEAGDHSNANGGEAFCRFYDTEEEAINAVTNRPDASNTEPSSIFTVYDITPENGLMLLTRLFITRDYPVGIYCDFLDQGPDALPVNNCGSFLLELKALCGIETNILGLKLPIGPDGNISIALPKIDKGHPDYFLLMSIRYGLNAVYAAQWAEGVFKEFVQNQNVKLSGKDLEENKKLLEQMFSDAYVGLHLGALWHEISATQDEIQDENARQVIQKMLKSPVGNLGLLRPATVVFNAVKGLMAHPESTELLDPEKVQELFRIVELGTAPLKGSRSDELISEENESENPPIDSVD